MLFQKVALKTCIPAYKKCFGNDERKLWSFVAPACILSLELAPCLILLGSDMATLEFWGLLVMQEFNPVLKNTGKYAEIYVAVRALLHRSVDEETLKLIEETRTTIAPCDNISEIVSPVIIMIAIGFESLFDLLRIERAPYFANNGVMGAWKNERFRGEAPLMLTIVFAVRIVFCWIEMKVRARQRGDETDPSTTADTDLQTPRTDTGGAAARSKTRRSSMAVLYTRIVGSDEVPVHMQYLAGVFFALQPLLFVVYAARFGKQF